MKKTNFESQSLYVKQNAKLRRIILISAVVLFLILAVFFSFFIYGKFFKDKVTIKNIKKAWTSYDYELCYDLSKQYLDYKPFNNTALTYLGYSSFFLSQSKVVPSESQELLDESINCLRIALNEANKSLKPQIFYILGRAYFCKNLISPPYYADLAVKFLTLAQENGYKADDIPEYLGLSYVSLDMVMESISAFTQALLIRESDTLLLSIAEQYYKAGEKGAAKQYLFRIINNSVNDEIVIKSSNLLGQIYIDEENYDDALVEFENVLKKNENSADAHYGIGVIYEKQGNLVKARSEWRKALKIQVNHPGALQKMSE